MGRNRDGGGWKSKRYLLSEREHEKIELQILAMMAETGQLRVKDLAGDGKGDRGVGWFHLESTQVGMPKLSWYHLVGRNGSLLGPAQLGNWKVREALPSVSLRQ